MSTIHVICGPTGVGKSDVANDLASERNAPILVADRLQCFTDLAVTTAREVDGEFDRTYLTVRQVLDGDYLAEDAVPALFQHMERLARDHPFVVIEGGSISVLRGLAEYRARFPVRLTFQVLRLGEHEKYRRRLVGRALKMLLPKPAGPGMLEELATAWKHREQQSFIATVNGFEAVLEWCSKNSVDPGTLAARDITDEMAGELADMIGYWHAEHGRDQDEFFSKNFGVA